MRLLSLFIITLACSSFLLGQAGEGVHRVKIYYSDADQLTRLQEAGVGIDHGRHKLGYSFESDFSERELQVIAGQGLAYDITIKHVDQYYRDQNNPESPHYIGAAGKNYTCSEGLADEVISPVNYHGGSMGGFLTYSEMLTELDEMYAYCQANGLDIMTPRADNINPADPDDFKTEGGYYQQWVRISDNAAVADDTEPQILYDALHHAREPASMQQLIFYMWYLLENYATNDEVKSIVDNTEMYFIPCVNPDGYLYNQQTDPNGGGFWRKNRRGGYGVDLNRNYSYITPGGEEVWNTTGVSNNRAGETFPGTGPFSEPESRAIRYFVETHNFTIALNNHTSGQLLLYPFGYEREIYSPDNSYFELLSDAMVWDNSYSNILSSELYPASGDSDDFMYGMLTTTDGGTREKVFAMTPEIGTSFWPAIAEIEGTCQGMLSHNLTAAAALNNLGVIEGTSGNYVNERSFPVSYNLTRLGFSGGGFSVSVAAVSDNIASVGTSEAHNILRQGDMDSGDIMVTLSEDIEAGEEVVFDLVLFNLDYVTRQRITKTYGELTNIVVDAADDLANWTSPRWRLTTNEFYPGSPSASITDSPNRAYSDDANSSIDLNDVIDLSATDIEQAVLSFYAKWEIESGYDQVQVLVSTTNGITWIPQCGKYTKEGVETHVTPGQPVYDGEQTEWVKEEISLNDYIGEQVKIRFQLLSDGGVTADGFYFDALSVDVIKKSPTGTEEPLTAPFQIAPNPVSNLLHMQTELTDYSVRLTNNLGQIVRSEEGRSGTGTLSVQGLPIGVYQLTVRAEGKQRTIQVVKK